MKNKKGFTLAEILGVIVIIGLLLLLVTPVIVSRLSSTKDDATEANNRIIYNAASQHILEHRGDYPAGKRYCITIRELLDEGKLASPVKDVVTGKTVDDNYSVLVSIYSTGNEYYEGPFVDKECEETSSIPMIDFLVEPSGTDWVKSRKVTIKYPTESTEKKYKIDNETLQDTTDTNKVLNFTKPGVLVANAKYQGTKTESKINIVNIDSILPTVEVDGQPTCKKSVTMILKDTGGSKLKDYAVIKGTSRPNDSEWKKTDKVNQKSIKFTAEDEVDYTVYVRDNAGNENKITFKPNVRHTVKFNLNNGTPAISDRVMINNKSYSQLGALPTRNDISRVGYIFRGWYEDNNTFAKPVTDSTIMCVRTADDTKNLYVKWEAKKVKVTFYRNTTSTDGTTATQTFTYGAGSQSFAERNWDNAKTGYSILGWNETRSATTSNYSELSGVSDSWIHSTYESHNADNSDTNPKNHTLYLIWRPNTFTINFSGNGNTGGSTNSVTCTYDKSCNLTSNGFTKTGYSFIGWSGTVNGSSRNFSNGESVTNLTSTDNARFTFNARWQANQYTVTYDGNGGTASVSSNKQTYDSNYSNLPTATRSGYTFVGWFTASSGGTQVTTSTKFQTANDNTVLYAQWKANLTLPNSNYYYNGSMYVCPVNTSTTNRDGCTSSPYNKMIVTPKSIDGSKFTFHVKVSNNTMIPVTTSNPGNFTVCFAQGNDGSSCYGGSGATLKTVSATPFLTTVATNLIDQDFTVDLASWASGCYRIIGVSSTGNERMQFTKPASHNYSYCVVSKG